MDFVHHSYQQGDTIAGIATPPGEGGVAIIRISGNEAIVIVSKIFSGPLAFYKSHTAHFGKIHNLHGEHVDDVLVLPMLGTRSYTGEDTVEIHCHGGALITRRVLETVLQAGARPARPGEFTFKAYMNGKMDLAQAEAVQSLIAAKNEHALNAAENQLQGALSTKIRSFQQQLTHVTAILEAWVDFPEEGLEFATIDEICELILVACNQMKQLLSTFHEGKIVQDGIALCLIGSPNVGKSSLMNALLDKERAIVSPIPGTTRDILEDHVRINGLNVRLLDTAGIRQSEEVIEQEGIRRSKEAMAQADLILCVLDSTQAVTSEEKMLIEKLPSHKTIFISNKIDLLNTPPSLAFPHHVAVSAKQKIGLDLLKNKIHEIIWKNGPPTRDEVLITNVRHKEALAQAITRCEATIQGLRANASPEFLTFDMRQSLAHLGSIIGTNIAEDVLSAIFSTFCIGK